MNVKIPTAVAMTKFIKPSNRESAVATHFWSHEAVQTYVFDFWNKFGHCPNAQNAYEIDLARRAVELGLEVRVPTKAYASVVKNEDGESGEGYKIVGDGDAVTDWETLLEVRDWIVSQVSLDTSGHYQGIEFPDGWVGRSVYATDGAGKWHQIWCSHNTATVVKIDEVAASESLSEDQVQNLKNLGIAADAYWSVRREADKRAAAARLSAEKEKLRKHFGV